MTFQTTLGRSRVALAAALMVSFTSMGFAQHYTLTNLVGNQTGAASHTDTNLVNGWGLSRSATSPWWVVDNGTGKSTLYNGTGVQSALVVTVPGGPTGTVFNGTTGFQLIPGKSALFLFAAEDGTISGWNPQVNPAKAQVVATTPGAVYKGLTIAIINGVPQLYAADFRNNQIDVFDTTFRKVNSIQGGAGFAPFNVQNIGDTLYVAFAQPDSAGPDELDGAGLGLIGAYTLDGRLIRFFERPLSLNAPWGMAMAPSEFGSFSHYLLVGQFGSGEILAFNPQSGAFAGKLLAPDGKTITIPGLWGISFGNGGNSGPLNNLYFTAGPDGESNGLFGSLVPVSTDLIQGNGN